MPVFSSYVKRDGTVEPAYDLGKYDTNDNSHGAQQSGQKGYKEFVLKIRSEQPMLYNTLIAAEDPSNQKPLTSAGIKDANSLTKYISDHTFNLTNGATPIALLEEEGTPTTKKGIFSKSK